MNARPLSFVLMTFGSNPGPTCGQEIDVNRSYSTAIKALISALDNQPTALRQGNL